MKNNKQYSIDKMCKVLGVSRSGYYDWVSNEESRRAIENRVLSVHVKAVYEETFQTYGAIRIHRELKDNGIKCSKNRVARLMKKEGIKSIHKIKFKPSTTDSKHLLPVADNVIEQDFSASAPNQKWGADITYIKTGEGFLYLAVVLDFFSRKIVGWATSDSLHSELCCQALNMALSREKAPQEIIHHSDRGVQYASESYREILTNNNFIQSMSRKGNCYDNAMTESFFHTLKVERCNRINYINRSSAKIDILRYIEGFYNNKRRHSSLDYLSPNRYLENIKNKRAA